jgi:hypothetical protein
MRKENSQTELRSHLLHEGIRLIAVALLSGAVAYAVATSSQVPPQERPLDPVEENNLRTLIDVRDRYQLTNERVNEAYKGIVYLAQNDKAQSESLAEVRAYIGIDRPTPVPRPRPTASERLKVPNKP